MKKIYLFAAALAAVCACQKNDELVQNNGQSVTITAGAGVSQTKITMGSKAGTAYPMSWDNEEHFYLREIAIPEGEKETVKHYVSSSFSKTDAHNAKISFAVAAQSIEGTYDYVSVYPCHPTDPTNVLDNGVRYGGDDQKNRASYILSYSRAQIPTADGPDKLTHIYWAYDLGKTAQASKINLDFQSVVSYGKMTVKNFPALAADETPTSITITGPSEKETVSSVTNYKKIMSGRVFKYFHETADYKVGDVVPYKSGYTMNYVKIDPTNITFNTTGFDVWFTTLPIKLTGSKDTLNVKVVTNKTTYVFAKVVASDLEFKEGQVSEFTFDYNKRIQDTKIVTFPFQSLDSVPEKWPTAADETWKYFDNCDSGLAIDTESGVEDPTNQHRRMTANITVNKETYTFTLAACDGAGGHNIFWNKGKGIQANAQRYFGLPVIEGMRITKIEYTNGASDKAANFRKVGVVDNIVAQTSETVSPHFIEGGKSIDNGPSGGGTTQYVFNVVNPLDDTGKTGKQIYLFCSPQTSIFRDMTITWEKVK